MALVKFGSIRVRGLSHRREHRRGAYAEELGKDERFQERYCVIRLLQNDRQPLILRLQLRRLRLPHLLSMKGPCPCQPRELIHSVCFLHRLIRHLEFQFRCCIEIGVRPE